jgi:hypothetical protein
MTFKSIQHVAAIMHAQHGEKAEHFVEMQAIYFEKRRPNGGARWRLILEALREAKTQAVVARRERAA